MKTLDRIKKNPKVELVSDERNSGSGVFAYLNPGWIDLFSETHCVHEDTATEVLRRLASVQPCNCDECKPKQTS